MAGKPLSPAWDKRLKAWGKYYGDGYTAQMRVIRLESAQKLAELRSIDRDLRQWLQPLPESGTLAVIKNEHWDRALALLSSYGIDIQEKSWW